jgi:hypothetical protein
MILIGIFKQETCIYGRKVQFNLIKTIECPLKLKAKSLDFSPELKKMSPDKLLILLQKTKVPKMQNYSEFFFSFIYIWFDRA